MSEYLPGEFYLGTLNSPLFYKRHWVGSRFLVLVQFWCGLDSFVSLPRIPFCAWFWKRSTGCSSLCPRAGPFRGLCLDMGNKSDHTWSVHQHGPVGSSCFRSCELFQKFCSHHPCLSSVNYWINTHPILLMKLILDKERKWNNRALVPRKPEPCVFITAWR